MPRRGSGRLPEREGDQGHFNDPTADARVAEQTAWIDDATGCLVHMVLDGSPSGFGWSYGAEVKDPPS